jgi:hypothetical protein
MHAKLVRLIACFIAAIFLCGVSHAQDAASAKAFLENLYAHYKHGYGENHSGIDFDGPNAALYFTSSLLALEHADVKANSPDIQAIDWDPVCGCQDWDGIWELEIGVELQPSQRARATVTFSLNNPKYHAIDGTRKLVFTLAAEHGAWRIDDILDRSDAKNTYSVRKLLQDDLAMLRKDPAPASH